MKSAFQFGTFRSAQVGLALLAGVAIMATAGCTSTSSGTETSSTSVVSAEPTGSQTDTGTAEPGTADQPTLDPNTTSATESEAPSPATTLVPPTNAGNTDATVPEGTITTNPPVSVSATSDLGNGVTIAITDAHLVDAIAVGPGEVGGTAVAITVVVTNSSADLVDLGSLTVSAQDAAGLPGLVASGAPANPIVGAVDAGQQVSGVYVFVLPPNHTNPMTYSVSSTPEVPVALFVGDTQ